jgi:FAD:protein FMN transferase
VPVDPELSSFLETAARLTKATAGAFDCATGALIRCWGFFKGPQRVPGDGELGAALAVSGFHYVQLANGTVRFLRRGTEINPGAIGKGFAIDRAVDGIVAHYGRGPVLLQGGKSSVRAVASPPGESAGWPVAIGDPFVAGRSIATVRLRDRALGTSAADRQFFTSAGRRYGHILDPRTGVPADTVASATAMAPTAAEADALSTAFFVMGIDATREYCHEHRDVGALLVSKPEAGDPPRVVAFGLAPDEVTLL